MTLAVLALTTARDAAHAVGVTNTEPLMTTQGAAEWANVHPQTIRRWVRDGLLRAYTLPTGVKRYRREDVEALLTGTGDAA